jgi:hypothetical protein
MICVALSFAERVRNAEARLFPVTKDYKTAIVRENEVFMASISYNANDAQSDRL